MRKSFLFQTFLWCIVVLLSVASFAQEKTKIDSRSFSAANNQNNSQSQSGAADATIIRWDNGVNFDAIGLTSGGTFEVSARFPASIMGPLAGQGLTQVEIYINDVPSPCTIKIYDQGTATSPGTLLYSETITVVGVSWNLITLATPVTVNGNDMWIGYELTHPAGLFPAGCDAGPAQADGDWIYLAPGPWAKLSVLVPSLNYNWNIAGYVEPIGPPCPVGLATNPNPASGATNVPANLSQISWTNGAGATSIEVIFNGSTVYTGSPVTTYTLPGTLSYSTTYSWRVNGSNDTCTTNGTGWTFTTESDPSIGNVNVYPQSVAMWTGATNGSTKTDGVINTVFPNVGWAVYDVSSIPAGSQILDLHFYGYVNATNWPYWSATPMGTVNPITATGSEISAQIQANRDQGVAYIFSDEGSSYAPGWHDYPLESTAVSDFENALNQGWFAMGFVDRDDVATYFVNFDGWSQANPPYIDVTFIPVPVELTSFTASASTGLVELSWITATETNNQGFEVQRSNGSNFETIAFINGHGTTTEPQAYSYSDRSVNVGLYNYRLKQIDFDGTFEYSNVIEADVPAPVEFALDQNYPNPFNPNTQIAFRLAVDSKVSLKVFDILGQEVATLANTNFVAGAHTVNFDASALNSGVYLYRLEATGIDGANFVNVKKMILTK